ncbi:MAG: B12-binding domain-containing radical SAM protein [Candidatus Helarchaeota archaeon]
MTIDILFIVPSIVDLDKKKPPKTLINTSFFPPLGVLYLSSYLEKSNFKTRIIDMEAEKYGLTKVIQLIRILKPKIIGISICAEALRLISSLLIEKIKNITNVPIIIGGVSPTIDPIYYLEKLKVNYVVRGEGEKTLLELVEYLLLNKGELEGIKGISYIKNGKIIHNPERELIKNLDTLPFPDWEKINMNRYFLSISYKKPNFSIIASRGCPYRCNFCSISVFKYYRYRSPKNVVDEIEILNKKYNIKDISFNDATLNVNPDWVISLCKELIKRKIKIKWRCLCRVDRINEKMLYYMKSAGCYNIAFGIESSKDFFLKFLNKDFTIKEVINAIKMVKKYKIEILTSFMYGIPGQNISDLQHNCKFIKKISPDYLSILILTPVIGTELYKMVKKKRLLINYFDNFEEPEKITTKRLIMKIPGLSEDIINYYIKKSYLLYFLSIKTIKKYLEKYFKNPIRFLTTIKYIIYRLY